LQVRFLSVQNKDYLGDTTELEIKIHVDKEKKVLHITDTGIGMSKIDLVKHLGTIAKSGTSDFLSAFETGSADTSNLIGQFGVGFYSAFLVADTVVVTSKHNDDKQHIWESDAESFSIMEDDREDEQLGRGTRISLYLKEEAQDFLETKTIKNLITKYSEFINFDIYLYTSKIIEVEAEEEEEEEDAEADTEAADTEDETAEDDEEDGDAEEEEEETAKMVEKTVWDWEIINANKPIWTRGQKDVSDEEYNKFYAAFTSNEGKEPLAKMHFTAEGEVTFRSILFVPHEAPNNMYGDYGKKRNNIKM
jgi:heat shock protein beta